MNIEQHIRNICKDAYHLMQSAEKDNNQATSERCGKRSEHTRLVFPMYYHGKNKNQSRFSEQEYRFAFVEAFNTYVCENQLDWYYSIETPTMGEYSFAEDATTTRSAQFDLVILDNQFNRLALIEFKAGSATKRAYIKDYTKLMNPEEDGLLRFFINVFKNTDKKTFETLDKKIAEAGKESKNGASEVILIDNRNILNFE